MKRDNPFYPHYLAIGGGMELSNNNPIVKKFIEHSGGQNSVITVLPTASEIGDEIGRLYQEMFSELSNDVKYFNIEKRVDVKKSDLLDRLKKTTGLFFTGGNQLKITSLLGGSPVMDFIRDAKRNHVFVAGTSAGASAMSDTMISWGPSDSMLKGNLQMSPGIGLVQNMVIDSHFVKRGRISRLLHLVSQNPGTLGVGVSEDTGILINGTSQIFRVIGSRQITVVNGRAISHTNIANLKSGFPFAVTSVKVHVLGPGYGYDCINHEVLYPDTPLEYEMLKEPSEVSDVPFKPIKANDW